MTMTICDGMTTIYLEAGGYSAQLRLPNSCAQGLLVAQHEWRLDPPRARQLWEAGLVVGVPASGSVAPSRGLGELVCQALKEQDIQGGDGCSRSIVVILRDNDDWVEFRLDCARHLSAIEKGFKESLPQDVVEYLSSCELVLGGNRQRTARSFRLTSRGELVMGFFRRFPL